MPIEPELQAKIDALENEKLKERILFMLSGPGNRQATDEEIFESMMLGHQMAKDRRARLREWQDDEVEAFASHFEKESPNDYTEFLRQEKEFNEIDAELALEVRHLIWEWMPGLSFSDCDELFSKFRDHVKSHLS